MNLARADDVINQGPHIEPAPPRGASPTNRPGTVVEVVAIDVNTHAHGDMVGASSDNRCVPVDVIVSDYLRQRGYGSGSTGRAGSIR